MTIEEKRQAIEDYCSTRPWCSGCKLESVDECYADAEDFEVDYNYDLVFGNKTDSSVSIVDSVNHPAHYTDGKIEVIDFIEDKKLVFCLGNAVKYISRAGKKDPTKEVEDLKKAKWYIERRIKELEECC